MIFLTLTAFFLRYSSVEGLASLAGVKRPVSNSYGAWTGLAPDDSPTALRDISSHDIYAFDFQ
jgi:hypothetical protein